ncbi:MAG TPA: TetR/AcrR family transcriptional regulator [Solirubrobacteraceae bacterium]|jgi:AcrR family transcriptional regulator|nr:TetR/AcrR family transcriptional regulator [Solirubrobacteraceae bacterium]
MPRPNRRQQLLDAAFAVIRRDGAQALTLDAVAVEAGVSKGGVLYHFGSKRALIDGLVDCWLDDFEARLEGPDLLAAYVRASDLSAAGPEVRASEFGMLAALIEEPEVLEVARERHADWMQRMLGGPLPREDAWLVRLAADGLWFADLLGIAAPAGDDRRRLVERLLSLAADEAPDRLPPVDSPSRRHATP